MARIAQQGTAGAKRSRGAARAGRGKASAGKSAARSPAGTTARRVHDDIDATLHARTARRGTAQARAESLIKGTGDAAWSFLKRHPFMGVAAVGAVGITAAATLGVGEIAIGLAGAFAAYRVLREGEPPMEAIEDLERDLH